MSKQMEAQLRQAKTARAALQDEVVRLKRELNETQAENGRLTEMMKVWKEPGVPAGCPPHAEIYVGDGKFAICDWQDWELVRGFNWCLTTRNRSGCLYAQSWDYLSDGGRKRVSMHRLIHPTSEGFFVDHINGNGLDNRRENLRTVTPSQNSFNQRAKIGSSAFKGVSFDKESGLWRAYIRVNGVRKYLGRHGTEIDAAKAYNMAAKENYGDYARFNDI